MAGASTWKARFAASVWGGWLSVWTDGSAWTRICVVPATVASRRAPVPDLSLELSQSLNAAVPTQIMDSESHANLVLPRTPVSGVLGYTRQKPSWFWFLGDLLKRITLHLLLCLDH